MKRFSIIRTTLLIAAVAVVASARWALVISISEAATATSTTTAATNSSLQAQIDTNNQQITDLNQQIATYQAELQKVGADKKTLQAAINSLDLQRSKVQAQVAVTQHQIATTQLQIQQLGGEIVDTKQTVAEDQVALGAYLRSLQKVDEKPLIVQLLSSESLTQAWANISATMQIQKAVQTEMLTLQTQEGNLADSETASHTQQQSLTTQQQSLVETEQSKAQLLAQTKSQEATYQKLLAAAQTELASFSTFAQNAGGSKLLGGQTQCDAWGCYYNQRDALWGNNPLNGTKYNLASDGCLVTSMAMVMTHYGYKDVTPVTINSDPNNFAAYYPAYLMITINVDGVSATRKTATIDATLATGNPVIVGLNAYGGTHFVVFVSGSKGNYVMRDPYIANGKDISFSANYSMKEIFSTAKVVISG